MLITDFLKWFFIPNGIVVVEESGKLSWFAAFKRLFSGGVKRNPYGPSSGDLISYVRVGMNVNRYKCRVCGVFFWSWRKKQRACYKFSCCRSLRRRRND